MTTTESAEQVALTAEQVGQRYSVTAQTIHSWSQRGAMPFARRVCGVLRWFVSDLEEWERTEFHATLIARSTGQCVVTRSGRDIT